MLANASRRRWCSREACVATARSVDDGKELSFLSAIGLPRTPPPYVSSQRAGRKVLDHIPVRNGPKPTPQPLGEAETLVAAIADDPGDHIARMIEVLRKSPTLALPGNRRITM